MVFVDRPDIAERIFKSLSNTSSHGCRIVVLRGRGGTGKTQMMLRYYYANRHSYKYAFWMVMDTKSSAISSYRDLAINLGLDDKTAIEGSEKKVIEWVRSWLQERTGWILLLDNADDVMSSEVFQHLPRFGGDIIITTRDFIPSNKAEVIHIDKMTEEEALSLLVGPNPIDGSTQFQPAKEIVVELDFLPLAINLARAYIDDMMVSLEDYLTMLKDRRNASVFSYRDEFSDYNHTVATVWQISFERVQSQDPIARKILDACCFLQPDALPMGFFERQSSSLELISSSTSPEDRQRLVRVAITRLVKLSFLTKTSDGVNFEDGGIFAIHRLTQKVLYHNLSSDDKAAWLRLFATTLNSETDYGDTIDDVYSSRARTLMNAYLPHIRHYAAHVGEEQFTSKDLDPLLTRTANYLLRHGIYIGTEELAKLLLANCEAVYGLENGYGASSLDCLARLYDDQGRYSEAKPLYQRALAIYEKAFGSEHPYTATSVNNLA